MNFTIDIEVETVVSAEIPPLLQTTAIAALTQQQLDTPAHLTLLLTDDNTLQQLNHRYRGLNKVTDVLSFEDGAAIAPNAPIYLGDIAISVPQAARQAGRGGHSVSAELQLLTVHGVLHLLGYDHATAEEQAVMWAAQATILSAIHAPIVAPKLMS